MSKRANGIPSLQRLLQDFFCHYLTDQRNVSPHTVAAYRDSIRLLLQYAEARLGIIPSQLSLSDFNSQLVLEFLAHLEQKRKNSVRSRNARMAAIRSFLKYVTFRVPTALVAIQQIQAIPPKRHNKPLLGFLTREEMQAVLDAPNRATWSGERDHVMLATLYNTGARVSEITSLRLKDVVVEGDRRVYITGKGRKERAVPLWKPTARTLARWKNRRGGDVLAPAFPNKKGQPLTRAGVEERLRRAVEAASEYCPSLKEKRISPHTIRHTTAMHLLQSGVDIVTLALWLGHESIETTHGYVEADLEMKEKALSRLDSPTLQGRRFKPTDALLAFLESL